MTVAAIATVLGGRKTLKRKLETEGDLQDATRAGLPVRSLPVIAQSLSMDRKALAKVVGISDRTLSRRLAHASRLSAEESDRTVRMARIVAKAIDTFGTEEKAARWLQAPNMVMQGQSPFSMLDTDTGVRWVETVLGRIDYGIYS